MPTANNLSQPYLYQLAVGAVRGGSKVALDMLVALPDMDSSFQGAWLFDYEFEESLKGHPVIGKRWRFRASYDINNPISVDEKREKLEALLSV